MINRSKRSVEEMLDKGFWVSHRDAVKHEIRTRETELFHEAEALRRWCIEHLVKKVEEEKTTSEDEDDSSPYQFCSKSPMDRCAWDDKGRCVHCGDGYDE